MRIDDVCIVNSDVDASDDFYRESVGLNRRMRNVRFADFDFGGGPRLAMWLRSSIAETVGPSYPSGPGLPFRVTLELPDAPAVEAAATRTATAVRLPATGTEPGRRRYAVTDPDGFALVLTPSGVGRTRVAEIELVVSDPVRTYDFLERLGFTATGDGGRMSFDGGGVVLTLHDQQSVAQDALPASEYASFCRSGGHVMLAIELDSGERVDELHHELVARGLASSGPPAVYEWGARSSYFVDPDGYIWEIYAWVEDPR